MEKPEQVVDLRFWVNSPIVCCVPKCYEPAALTVKNEFCCIRHGQVHEPPSFLYTTTPERYYNVIPDETDTDTEYLSSSSEDEKEFEESVESAEWCDDSDDDDKNDDQNVWMAEPDHKGEMFEQDIELLLNDMWQKTNIDSFTVPEFPQNWDINPTDWDIPTVSIFDNWPSTPWDEIVFTDNFPVKIEHIMDICDKTLSESEKRLNAWTLEFKKFKLE